MRDSDAATHETLRAYASGKLARAEAMERLGLTWYGDLQDALAAAGIEVAVDPERHRQMVETAVSLLAGQLKAKTGLAGAVAKGEAARLEWVSSGEVVPASALSVAWGITSQALGPAAKRGEVFAVMVRNKRYYPSEFMGLDRNDVATICQELKELDPTEQLVFWKRKHGRLGGKTLLEVLSARPPQMETVLRLARALQPARG